MFKRLKTILLPVAILAAVFGGASANAVTLPETRVGGYQIVDAASRQVETTQPTESQQASGFAWYDTASECSVAAKNIKPPWLSWAEYEKVLIGDTEYAKVGSRLYTRHAVERTYPSGLGVAAGGVKGRSIAPAFIEDALTSPQTVRSPVTGPLGQVRVSHVSGSVEVITEGDIVVTVITH